MPVPAVRCAVLGPIEVVGADGRLLTPAGALQRRLLAMLLLRRDRVVSVDSIAEALWPERLPDDHAAAVHTHVFRLRRRLPDLPIDQRAPGYRLADDALAVDADEFERSVADGVARRTGDPLRALEDLDRAIALWRGRPFVDLADSADASIEADRLEQVLVRAQEERLDALLDLGRADEVVPDADSLVARHPLSERPREVLMRALAATGRHADALRTYDDLRRLLAVELGIEPSARLQALNATILAGDGAPVTVGEADPTASQRGAGGLQCPPPRLARPLVGRRSLVRQIGDALERSRVVTLVGTGGVGKTSLAVAAAEQGVTRFPDGVCFVELTSSSPGSAAADLLAAVGVEPRHDVPPGRRLASLAGSSRLLLVLDNCEHVLDDVAPLIEDVIAHSDALCVLATSRERLSVAGETLVPVPPLRWDVDPSAVEDADAEHEHGDDATTAPALDLFVERARDAGVTLDLDERTRPVVAEICRRLDGLPLAIELAANRLASLRLDEICDGLEHSIRLLSGGRRAVPRHRSMAAALTWSFDLLDGDQRDLMDVLAVFASPFSADDVVAVSGRNGSDVGLVLADLVERSLVHRTADRFMLLEPVRQFVQHTAGEGEERLDRARRHAARFTEVAEQSASGLRTQNAAEAFARTRSLVPDLRAAIRTALDGGDLDTAARLCTAVRDSAFHAMIPEPLTWAKDAAEAALRIDHPRGPSMCGVAALGAWKSGDLEAAGHLLDAAVDQARRLGLDVSYFVHDMCGTLAAGRGQLDEAVTHYLAALETPEGRSDPLWRSETSATLVLARSWRREPDVVTAAEQLVGPSLPDDCPVGAAWRWYAAGEAVLVIEPELARERLARAVDLARTSGSTFVEVVAGASLASLEVRHGDPARAAAAYRWLLPLMQRGEAVSPLWTALRCVTELLVACGVDEPAAQLLGAVTSPLHGHLVFGDDVAHLERVRSTLAGRLGADHLERAVERGRSLDDAVATMLATTALDEHLPG